MNESDDYVDGNVDDDEEDGCWLEISGEEERKEDRKSNFTTNRAQSENGVRRSSRSAQRQRRDFADGYRKFPRNIGRGRARGFRMIWQV